MSTADSNDRVYRAGVQRAPFSVLVPKSGELSGLLAQRELLEERLSFIRDSHSGLSDEEMQARLGEESMLVQVLQWIVMGSGEREEV